MVRKHPVRWIGLDVGGANLKAAAPIRVSESIVEGRAEAMEFPLWKQPEKLGSALRRLICKLGGASHVAVTMTGELADCFETKREGVSYIAKACAEAAGDAQVAFYSVKGTFLPQSKAKSRWEELAASNWHALGVWQARKAASDEAGLIIDVGSTTTDILPFARRRLACRGWNDTDRLLAGELVYTGVERSPVAGIVSHLPLRGKFIPVMNELFATSLDAHLLLGHLPEDKSTTNTADGRPATKKYAHARLARMVGGDATTISREEAIEIARYIVDQQAERIAAALRQVCAKFTPREILHSGHGRPLVELALKKALPDAVYRHVATDDANLSRSLPAVAVAILAQEHFAS